MFSLSEIFEKILANLKIHTWEVFLKYFSAPPSCGQTHYPSNPVFELRTKYLRAFNDQPKLQTCIIIRLSKRYSLNNFDAKQPYSFAYDKCSKRSKIVYLCDKTKHYNELWHYLTYSYIIDMLMSSSTATSTKCLCLAKYVFRHTFISHFLIILSFSTYRLVYRKRRCCRSVLNVSKKSIDRSI